MTFLKDPVLGFLIWFIYTFFSKCPFQTEGNDYDFETVFPIISQCNIDTGRIQSLWLLFFLVWIVRYVQKQMRAHINIHRLLNIHLHTIHVYMCNCGSCILLSLHLRFDKSTQVDVHCTHFGAFPSSEPCLWCAPDSTASASDADRSFHIPEPTEHIWISSTLRGENPRDLLWHELVS